MRTWGYLAAGREPEARMSNERRANIISALIFLGLAFAFAHSFGFL
jgi:hypothetical protein